MQVNISGRMRGRFLKVSQVLEKRTIEKMVNRFPATNALGAIEEQRVVEDPTNPHLEKSHRYVATISP